MPQNYNSLKNASGAAYYGTSTALTSYFAIPVGTSNNRDFNVPSGALRYNSTLFQVEHWDATYNSWMSVQSFANTSSFAVEYLVVAGGGGGGTNGGGGGAGGFRTASGFVVGVNTNYTVTVAQAALAKLIPIEVVLQVDLLALFLL